MRDVVEKTPYPFPPLVTPGPFPELAPWGVPIADMSGWWLSTQCACGEGSMPLRLLSARVGWNQTLESVAPRMRCKRCGEKPASIDLIDTPGGRNGRFGAREQRVPLVRSGYLHQG